MKKNDKSYCDWDGDYLRKKRKELGLSQIVMAGKLGLSERGYRCYETDTYQIPIPIKYAVLYLMNDGEASIPDAEKMEDRLYVSRVLLQCDKEMQLMLSKMN